MAISACDIGVLSVFVKLLAFKNLNYCVYI